MADRYDTIATEQAGAPEMRMALRPKEAAKSLGIGERLLWEKTNCGEIPHLRIGKAVLYPVAVLESWLSDQAKGVKR